MNIVSLSVHKTSKTHKLRLNIVSIGVNFLENSCGFPYEIVAEVFRERK